MVVGSGFLILLVFTVPHGERERTCEVRSRFFWYHGFLSLMMVALDAIRRKIYTITCAKSRESIYHHDRHSESQTRRKHLAHAFWYHWHASEYGAGLIIDHRFASDTDGLNTCASRSLSNGP